MKNGGKMVITPTAITPLYSPFKGSRADSNACANGDCLGLPTDGGQKFAPPNQQSREESIAFVKDEWGAGGKKTNQSC